MGTVDHGVYEVFAREAPGLDGLASALDAIFNPQSFYAFVLLLVPGTIAIRLYDRLRARRSREIVKSFIDIVIVSGINDVFWLPIFKPIGTDLRDRQPPDWTLSLETIAAFIVSPIVLSLVYFGVENLLGSLGIVSDAEARPWDKWFQRVKSAGKPIGVIVIMKSDHRAIGGRYVPPGFASSAPAPESIHIGETWILDDGRFVERVDASEGIYIRMDDVETMEFFDWSKVEPTLEKGSLDGS